MHSCLYLCDLMHQRLRPRRHRFNYRLTSWLIDLDELEQLDQSGLLAVNRGGWISFRETDFGDRSDTPLKQQCQQLLLRHGLPQARSVRLLCHPRTLGIQFNPLVVYFCFDANEQLFATLYEVSNTFGERHTYVIRVAPTTSSWSQASEAVEQQVSKRLFVSPFIALEGGYSFRLNPPDQQLSLLIRYHDGQGPLLLARWRGERQPLTKAEVWRERLQLPVPLKIVTAIHWQALRLWIKRTPFISPIKTARYRVSLGHPGRYKE